jgi:hypothetical protein
MSEKDYWETESSYIGKDKRWALSKRTAFQEDSAGIVKIIFGIASLTLVVIVMLNGFE